MHDNLLGRDDVQLIISDHRHNPFLNDGTRKKMESPGQVDEERWKVYAHRLTGKVSAFVLTNWELYDVVPGRQAS